MNEKPTRTFFSGMQQWKGTREQTFKLLCPVLELEWTPGWEVRSVFSNSGVVEDECVFLTPAISDPSRSNLWIVTEHRPLDFVVEMYKISPEGVIMKLNIELVNEADGITDARLSMTQTAYTTEGKAIVHSFDETYFANYMSEWETAINYYLEKGIMIPEMPC